MAKKAKKSQRPVKAEARSAKKTARGASAAKRTARRRIPAKAKRMAAKPRQVSPIPAGVHTVTPNLVLSDCVKALGFYKEAFGAKELMRMMTPDGQHTLHAEMRIGDSIVYMSDAMDRPAPSKESPTTTSVWLYVPDADAVFERAVEAGATIGMPMMDAFWGDRMGMLLDPFGLPWGVATHVKDMSEEDLRKAGEEFFRQMATQSGGRGVESSGEPPQVQDTETSDGPQQTQDA